MGTKQVISGMKKVGELVVEAEYFESGSAAAIVLTISVPGREGTFTKTWSSRDGLLDSSQVEDLTVWISKAVTTGLLRFTGTQESLLA